MDTNSRYPYKMQCTPVISILLHQRVISHVVSSSASKSNMQSHMTLQQSICTCNNSEAAQSFYKHLIPAFWDFKHTDVHFQTKHYTNTPRKGSTETRSTPLLERALVKTSSANEHLQPNGPIHLQPKVTAINWNYLVETEKQTEVTMLA